MEIIKKVKLTETDIKVAIAAYLIEQGVSTERESLEIDFTAGRAGKGLSASIDLTELITPIQKELPLETPKASSIQEMDQAIADEEEDALMDAEDMSDTVKEEPEEEEVPPSNSPLFGQ